jgi:hypothetical protein
MPRCRSLVLTGPVELPHGQRILSFIWHWYFKYTPNIPSADKQIFEPILLPLSTGSPKPSGRSDYVRTLTTVYQFPLPLVTSPGTSPSVQEYAYDPFPKMLWRFSSALPSMNVHAPWEEESSCGQVSFLVNSPQSEREGVNAPRALRQPMTSEGEASPKVVALRM